jgi:ferrochelatase
MKGAVLLVSHGSVDELDDLPAFLTNVRRGRPPPPELVLELRRRYEAIGGRSPLNASNAEIARRLEGRLGVTVAWANRLFRPYVRDVVVKLARDGVTRIAVVPLAQHSAHIYEEDARRAAEGTGIAIACARNWGRDPGLCMAFASRIANTLSSPESSDPRVNQARATVITTAHSLPRSIVDAGDPYETEVRASAEAVVALLRTRFGREEHCTMAFQSQGIADAGPGGRAVAWLGPDLRATLDDVASRGDRRVVFAPIGFLADHVEILYDLDIEARAMAIERGLSYARVPSLNADSDFIEVLARVALPLLHLDHESDG